MVLWWLVQGNTYKYDKIKFNVKRVLVRQVCREQNASREAIDDGFQSVHACVGEHMTSR